jgi:vitamin K-dependent gamma-carboxylase
VASGRLGEGAQAAAGPDFDAPAAARKLSTVATQVRERPPATPRGLQRRALGEIGFRRRLGGLQERLFLPVDGASLAVFRIAFGLVMVWESWRYFSKGWISANWIEPTFYFTFWGFDWVQPWGGDGMYWQWRAVGFFGLLVALGLFYRLSCALLFLSITYLFLLDKAWYLNHIYLVCLIAFILIFVPAHRVWSLDAVLRKPGLARGVPTWALWLVRAQIAVVYFGGGIAKLNSDWLRGEPLRQWLAERSDFFVLGRFFHEEWFVYLFSYGGLLLDLLIVPFLLWRRTRALAFAAAVFFHVTNSELFNIGIFPWLALGATTIFFAPDWPRRALRWLGRTVFGRRVADPTPLPAASAPAPWRRTLLLGFVGVYLLVQVLMPLRHWLYPGKVHWTEEGHRFAWHMKLRDKEAVEFFVYAVDPVTGRYDEVIPEDYLTPNQFDEMSTRPDMIRQFADHVADEYEQGGRPRPEVYVRALVQLNDHEPRLMLDSNRNLAELRDRPFAHADWILPFER